MERQAQVDFNEVRVSADSTLGAVNGGWPALERALQRAATAKGLEMVGGAEAVLDMTLDYLKDRVQFGRPVGTFQALQHHCANMAIDLEGSRYAVYQAAYQISEGTPGPSGGFGGQGVGERRLHARVRYGGPMPRSGGVHGGAQPAAIHSPGRESRSSCTGTEGITGACWQRG